jgi:radical SAM/Cys-rich protein
MPPSAPSLQKLGSELALSGRQIELLENTDCGIRSFRHALEDQGKWPLKPAGIDILQINTGYLCNLVCTHCHVDAGPDRKEIMTRETMAACLEALKDQAFRTVDITGGAPEMNPDFLWFIDETRKARPDIEILVRTNLTILVSGMAYRHYPEFLKEQSVNLIASLPCYTRENVDHQRGVGVFERSVSALKRLNDIGYGKENTGLELSLVYNPSGPYLPGSQGALEKDYKERLFIESGITFNRLYTITNMPISRFLNALLESGSFCSYMELLARSFNPAAVDALMCRNTLSVRWDGKLYDCDFNQMLDLGIDPSVPQHISDFDRAKFERRTVMTGQHCYGCTAGSGSSCQGCLL